MKKITRREMLAGLGVAGLSLLPGCGGGGTSGTSVSSAGDAPVPAPQPSVPPAPSVVNVTLDVKMATNQINGQPFTARSFNGLIGGPHIRVKPGDNLKIRVNNQLGPSPPVAIHDINVPHGFNNTNIHTHGLHVSPLGNSDNIFIDIAPGESFDYSYQIPSNHAAGTFFYHPHKHGSSTMQNFSGMGGMLIVEGAIDQVPQVKAAREIPFYINELMRDPATAQVPDYTVKGAFKPAFRIYTVNAQAVPNIEIRPGEVVRLRVVNAGVSWSIPLQVEGHVLHEIAFDGITLPLVTDVDTELLAPGNRVDVLIKGGAPGVYNINKLEHQQAAAIFGPIARTPKVLLARLVVAGEPMQMELPTLLPVPRSLPTIRDSEITNRRTVVYSSDFGNGGPAPPQWADNFTIDGKRFEVGRVDQLVQLGAVEEWTITNPMEDTEHPFHIHQNPFQVVAINGAAVTPRWQDTVLIPLLGSVTMRTRFEDFTGLFVNHCHFLAHEDQGMMQTVSVV